MNNEEQKRIQEIQNRYKNFDINSNQKNNQSKNTSYEEFKKQREEQQSVYQENIYEREKNNSSGMSMGTAIFVTILTLFIIGTTSAYYLGAFDSFKKENTQIKEQKEYVSDDSKIEGNKKINISDKITEQEKVKEVVVKRNDKKIIDLGCENRNGTVGCTKCIILKEGKTNNTVSKKSQYLTVNLKITKGNGTIKKQDNVIIHVTQTSSGKIKPYLGMKLNEERECTVTMNNNGDIKKETVNIKLVALDNSEGNKLNKAEAFSNNDIEKALRNIRTKIFIDRAGTSAPVTYENVCDYKDITGFVKKFKLKDFFYFCNSNKNDFAISYHLNTGKYLCADVAGVYLWDKTHMPSSAVKCIN